MIRRLLSDQALTVVLMIAISINVPLLLVNRDLVSGLLAVMCLQFLIAIHQNRTSPE